MTDTALKHVLHYNCPEWNDSIRSAWSEAGYTFDLGGDKLWEWIISGHLNVVREIADREVKRLELQVALQSKKP